MIKINVPALGNIDYISLFLGRACRKIYMEGWAVDVVSKTIASKVLVEIGNIRKEAEYGLPRYDVSYYYNCFEYNNSGFRCELDVSSLKDDEYELFIKIVNSKRDGYYEMKINVVIDNSSFLVNLSYFINLLKFKYYSIFRFAKGFFKKPLFIFSLLKNFVLFLINKLLHKNLILINLEEHIGDIVACEPVSRLLKESFEKTPIIWVTSYRYKELVAFNPNINSVICVTCLFEWILIKKFILTFLKDIKIFDLHVHGKECTAFRVKLDNPNLYRITIENYYSYGSLLEVFMMAAGLKPIDLCPIFYFSPKIKQIVRVNKEYIVVHTSSNEICRHWTRENWIRTFDFLIDKGFFVIEIGLESKFDYERDGYINLCGKHSLQQLAYLIKKSFLFIGIDSAFAHIANALNVPGIILLGYYRAFRKYIPYSGKYKKGENAIIIQYDEYLKNLPFETVRNAIEKIIGREK